MDLIEFNGKNYPHFQSIGYAADWDYFDGILKTNPSIVRIDKILFVHN